MSCMDSSGRTWPIYTGTVIHVFPSISSSSAVSESWCDNSKDLSCSMDDNRNGQLVAWQLTILFRYTEQSLSKVFADRFELSVIARAEPHAEQTSMSSSAFCQPNLAQKSGERQGGLA